MKKLLNFLQTFFRPPRQPEPAVDPGEGKLAHIMAHMLAVTSDVELGCDEVFELIDQYAELVQRGEKPENIILLVEKHLAMCPECADEYEALKRVLAHG